MNYIELINRFWNANEEHSFKTTDIALYFYLLKVNNDCSWKESFKRNNKKVEVDLNISFNTLKDARNRLKIANLIYFKTVNGNANVTYSFSITLSKYDEVTNEVYIEVSNEVSTRLVPSKDKLNKTKVKGREKEKIPTPENPIFDTFMKKYEVPLLECKQSFLQDELHIHRLKKQYGNDIPEWINKFFAQLELEGVETKSLMDAKSHFTRWYQTKTKSNENSRRNIQTTKHSEAESF